jgi:hypothetical protein
MDEIERRSFAWNSRDICISLDLVSSWFGMAVRYPVALRTDTGNRFTAKPSGAWNSLRV